MPLLILLFLLLCSSKPLLVLLLQVSNEFQRLGDKINGFLLQNKLRFNKEGGKKKKVCHQVGHEKEKG